ncbi:recombination regulator RecX [Ornithinibacillus sp. 4-3]|uniref:Regulatory protein RecX n=1 Tax=Ornithinibacillus sp. 4-3 TaxID=3231488 RepID=A0AB39HJC3_9BACI
MLKIARITTQKKNKHRYNIYVDRGQADAYAFSVDEDVLLQYQLHKGQELDEALLEEITKQDETQKFYLKVIYFLSFRMRSEKEILDYLKRHEVEEEQIASIMSKLTEQNLIDDFAFAKMFVQTRMNTSTKGPVFIKNELRQKGIKDSIITEAIQLFEQEEQLDKVRKIVKKRLKQTGKQSFRKQIQSIQIYLLRSGFSSDIISEVIKQLEENKNEASEWDAMIEQGHKLMRKHERKFSGYELEMKIKEGLYRQGFQTDIIQQFIDEELKAE